MYIRENIRTVGANPTKIKKLRKAFQEIMGRIDNQGYAHVANYHGWLDGLCEHAPETDLQGNINHNFLPWYRAYLLKLEKLLQQRDADVSLPWWNWRSQQSKREVNTSHRRLKDRIEFRPNGEYIQHEASADGKIRTQNGSYNVIGNSYYVNFGDHYMDLVYSNLNGGKILKVTKY